MTATTAQMWGKRLRSVMSGVWRVIKGVIGIPFYPYMSVVRDFRNEPLWLALCLILVTFAYTGVVGFVMSVYYITTDRFTVTIETVLEYKQNNQCVFILLRELDKDGILITGRTLREAERVCEMGVKRGEYKAAFQ